MKITLTLTRDEFAVLRYLVRDADSGWGEPLKDIYDEDDCPDDPEATLGALIKKVRKAKKEAA